LCSISGLAIVQRNDAHRVVGGVTYDDVIRFIGQQQQRAGGVRIDGWSSELCPGEV
jgi:hypothetical protein